MGTPGSEHLFDDAIDRRIHDLRLEIEQHPYLFDRRFLFRVLSMGLHSGPS